MSAMLFILTNCSMSFSAEEAKNGEIAAHQILACIAVRMCAPINENSIRVACCGACLWPRSTDYELCLRAYFKAGTMPTSICDFWPRGSLKYRNLAKRLCAIIAFVHTLHKRFSCSTSSFNKVAKIKVEILDFVPLLSSSSSSSFFLLLQA